MASAEKERATILVADDNPEARELIEGILEAAYEIKTVTTGAEALAAAAEEAPDLAIIDVEMPGLDGFETVKVLRAMRGLEEMPVLMVTAHRDIENVVRGLELGVSEYITKPFSMAHLRERVDSLLD